MMSEAAVKALLETTEAQLKEAIRLRDEAPKDSLEYRINRDIALLCKGEVDVLVQILGTDEGNNWQVLNEDKYWYASGRNYDTYVEVTYWVNDCAERKETTREVTILSGDTSNLPEWAKGITVRRKSLEQN